LALVPLLILTGEEIESDMNFSFYATKKEYLRESMYTNEYKFQFSYILMSQSMIVIFIKKVINETYAALQGKYPKKHRLESSFVLSYEFKK
jgi:hypothetical protein